MCAVADAGDRPVTAEALASSQGLPPKFLESILNDLRRAGLLRSQRGAEGGYRLARAAKEITVADIIRPLDGPLAEVRGLRPEATNYEGAAAHLQNVWVAVRSSLRSVLEVVTLADIVAGKLPSSVVRLTTKADAWVSHSFSYGANRSLRLAITADPVKGSRPEVPTHHRVELCPIDRDGGSERQPPDETEHGGERAIEIRKVFQLMGNQLGAGKLQCRPNGTGKECTRPQDPVLWGEVHKNPICAPVHGDIDGKGCERSDPHRVPAETTEGSQPGQCSRPDESDPDDEQKTGGTRQPEPKAGEIISLDMPDPRHHHLCTPAQTQYAVHQPDQAEVEPEGAAGRQLVHVHRDVGSDHRELPERRIHNVFL